MIPWNRFEVYFLKIPFSPISTINFSSDLIKIEDYVKKFLNSLWIRHVFTIIPLNSIHFYQIGKFGIIFDVIPHEIDDLAVSSRQRGASLVGCDEGVRRTRHGRLVEMRWIRRGGGVELMMGRKDSDTTEW